MRVRIPPSAPRPCGPDVDDVRVHDDAPTTVDGPPRLPPWHRPASPSVDRHGCRRSAGTIARSGHAALQRSRCFVRPCRPMSLAGRVTMAWSATRSREHRATPTRKARHDATIPTTSARPACQPVASAFVRQSPMTLPIPDEPGEVQTVTVDDSGRRASGRWAGLARRPCHAMSTPSPRTVAPRRRSSHYAGRSPDRPRGTRARRPIRPSTGRVRTAAVSDRCRSHPCTATRGPRPAIGYPVRPDAGRLRDAGDAAAAAADLRGDRPRRPPRSRILRGDEGADRLDGTGDAAGLFAPPPAPGRPSR